MQVYLNLLKKINLLSPSNKMKLIKDIYKLLKLESLFAEKVPDRCPYCGHLHIVKNGKNKNKQRYLCKNCHKSFISVTNTPIYYSRKDNLTWNKFIECLINRDSVRKTSRILKISPSTAFFWRHKVLDALRENQKENFKMLEGKVECTEIRFKESFKGNHSKSSFKMPREVCRYPRYDIRNFSRRNVYVVAAIDTKTNNFIAPIGIGILKREVFINSLKRNSSKGSTFFTDHFPDLYPRRKDLNNGLFLITFAAAFHKEGIKNIPKIRSGMSRFFMPYRGVATKYLYNYISLYRYLCKKYGEIRDNTINKIHLEDYQFKHYEYPIFIKGSAPYYIKRFKDRQPIIDQ